MARNSESFGVDSLTPPKSPAPAVSNSTFGLLLFLVTETMFFAALVAMYIVLRESAPEGKWRPPGFEQMALGVPLSNLVILVISALILWWGARCLKREDPSGLKVYVAITLVCGLTFLGVQVWEFSRMLGDGVLPLDGRQVFPSVFYACAGLHGAHVLGGVVFLTVILVQSCRGRYHRYRRVPVDFACAYWYFVVIVWIFFFLILYVL